MDDDESLRRGEVARTLESSIGHLFATILPCPQCGSEKVGIGLDEGCRGGRYVCRDCGHAGPTGTSTPECIRLWNRDAGDRKA